MKVVYKNMLDLIILSMKLNMVNVNWHGMMK